MPVWLMYILTALALGVVAGVGFVLGKGLASFFSIIGFLVIVGVLWQPFIKPWIAKLSEK